MNIHMPPKEARRTTHWFSNLPDKLNAAFENYDIRTSEAYAGLSELATSVIIEGHSIDVESTIIDGKNWIAPGTIYVSLRYDPNSDDPVELSDSYPITVNFSVSHGDVNIEGVKADVSSFYR